MRRTVIFLFIIVLLICASGACSVKNEYKQENQIAPDITETTAAPQSTPQPTPRPTPSITPQPTPEKTAPPVTADTPEEISIKRDLLVWKMAYPEYITGYEMDNDGFIYAVVKSGKKILYDDKKKKTFSEKMNNADLEDALEIMYPLSDQTSLFEDNYDPGRMRPYALFKEVYGNNKKAVIANSVSVNLGDRPFNKNNGASRAIMNVFDTLNELCSENSSFNDFIYPLNLTFCYRYIAGTKNLSMHSYAVAIDLNAKDNPSWRSVSREKGQKRLSAFPAEIVCAFEDNGFIWGGKWAHFDIMHFEYRPEIIIKSKYNVEAQEGQPWYSGFPDDEQVKSYIEMIDNVFKLSFDIAVTNTKI